MGENEQAVAVQQEDEVETMDIFEIIKISTGRFFFDQFGEVFAEIKNDTLPVNSRRFKAFVARTYYEDTGKMAGTEKINSAINLIAAYANEQRYLYNRIAWDEGRVLYNMGDKDNSVVAIGCLGWYFIDNELPLVFRRMNHQKAQVIPERPGNLELLRKYLPLNDKNWYLLKVLLVSYFIPHVPKPVLCTHGPQGSGKTTICKRLKSLIDPSIVETTSFPKDHEELVQMLSHHYFIVFDNVSYLKESQSDTLCRAVTGEGFSKRMLYTDDEDKIFSFRSTIALNGINAVPQKPDLLDRSILIEVERIPTSQRKTEEEMAFFEIEKPKILASIFDILSKAIELRPEIKLKEKPRMADFAVWGEAISRAMGYSEGKFIEAYFENIKFQNEEAVSANVIGEVFLEFINEKLSWEGTSTELLDELNKKADDMKLSMLRPGWPKAPHTLSRKIRELKTNLQEMGIEILNSRSGSKRTLLVRKASSEPSQASNTTESIDSANVSGDGINTDLEGFVTSSVIDKSQDKGDLVKNDGNDANDAACHYHRDRKAVGNVKDPYAPGDVPLCSECLGDGHA
jgi:hypothetical protein